MPTYDPFQFAWRCSEQGYEWKEGKFFVIGDDSAHEGPALVSLGQFDRVYVPEPELFLKFAAVDPDQDDKILEFANSYGLLGFSPLWLFPKSPSKSVKTTNICGELRSHWHEHLHSMKAAVSLWEALRKENMKLLSQCILWRGADRVDYNWPPSSDFSTPWSTHVTIASKQVDPELLNRFKPGDVEIPARLYLQAVVNKNLKKLVAPNLLWMVPDRKRMGLYIVPDSLIGCLWLQLAGAIAELRKFRTCEGCGKTMLVASEGSGFRTNRRTCSGACRVRLYARRKLEARRLRSEKLPLREIANRLDTGVEQVKKWMAER
jgi:hypothetical protein